MVHHSSCLLCGSENIGILFGCTDHLVSGEKFDIAECGSCGFLFTQDYPDENEISKYYESEDYISHSDSSAGIIAWLYRFVRKLMLRRKRNLVRRMTGLRSGKRVSSLQKNLKWILSLRTKSRPWKRKAMTV